MEELIEFAQQYRARKGKNPFIFLSGAISNRMDVYKDIFDEVEEIIKELGLNCYNPAIIPPDTKWSEAMEQTLKIIQHVDCIFVLQEWEDSVGTKVEISKARSLGIPVIYEKY